MFVELMTDIRKSIASLAFRAQLAVPQPRPMPLRRIMMSGPSEVPETRASTLPPAPEPREPEPEPDPLAGAIMSRPRGVPLPQPMDVSRLRTNRDEETARPAQQPVHAEKTVGRNDPCPCGSGKKYKKCHGAGLA